MFVTDNRILEGISGLQLLRQSQILHFKDEVEVAVCSRGCAKQLLGGGIFKICSAYKCGI